VAFSPPVWSFTPTVTKSVTVAWLPRATKMKTISCTVTFCMAKGCRQGRGRPRRAGGVQHATTSPTLVSGVAATAARVDEDLVQLGDLDTTLSNLDASLHDLKGALNALAATTARCAALAVALTVVSLLVGFTGLTWRCAQ
jgi:hypothetical protein